MFHHVHRQRRFTHTGAAGDDYEFAPVKTVGHFIQTFEAARNARERVWIFAYSLKLAENFRHAVENRFQVACAALRVEVVNSAFRLGESTLRVFRRVGAFGYGGAGAYKPRA